jgi:hypothetical protein
MMRNWIGTIGLATLLAGSAHAGVLGPTKPSQLVNLLASPVLSGTACGHPAFDIQNAADGTRQPFDIPPGQVLVVTGLEWNSAFGTASTQALAFLVIQSPDGLTCNAAFSTSGAVTDAWGNADATLTIPNGIAVKSGAHLGLQVTNGTLNRAKLYGYLAKDR